MKDGRGINTVSPPGETLQEILDDLCFTQKMFGEMIGKPQGFISRVINGQVAITPQTAILFEQVLGPPAIFWLVRDANYQLYRAQDRLHRLRRRKQK